MQRPRLEWMVMRMKHRPDLLMLITCPHSGETVDTGRRMPVPVDGGLAHILLAGARLSVCPSCGASHDWSGVDVTFGSGDRT